MGNKSYLLVVAGLFSSMVVSANGALSAAVAPQPAAKPSAAQPQTGEKQAAGPQTGKVLEVLKASNYTYLRVDTGREKIWLAAPQMDVKSGEKVTFGTGMPMKNFQSKSLGRTFETIYFVDQIGREGAKPIGKTASQSLPQGHPNISQNSGGAAAAKLDFSRITKASGGKTIAEIYSQRAQLAGKKIAVRGKVVKFNSGVMGKNWIHLRDGTGAEGSNDLTVTSKSGTTKVGDTLLVRGTVVTDKDYGYGYKYPVIMEDAEVTVEK